jgi:hypothetical protein
MRSAAGTTRLAPVGALVALLPVLLNWKAVNRRSEPVASEARDVATRILDSAPKRAVILARGDNETYPVWYLQEVERTRPDVTVVVVPLLPAQWYRAELERRHALLPHDVVMTWKGTGPSLAAVCARSAELNRPVVRAGAGTDSTFLGVCELR